MGDSMELKYLRGDGDGDRLPVNGPSCLFIFSLRTCSTATVPLVAGACPYHKYRISWAVVADEREDAPWQTV